MEFYIQYFKKQGTLTFSTFPGLILPVEGWFLSIRILQTDRLEIEVWGTDCTSGYYTNWHDAEEYAWSILHEKIVSLQSAA